MATARSVEAMIRDIATTIVAVNQTSRATASAVEQQGAATAAIARNVQQAWAGTAQVTQNIAAVCQGPRKPATPPLKCSVPPETARSRRGCCAARSPPSSATSRLPESRQGNRGRSRDIALKGEYPDAVFMRPSA